jgi:anti-anti-sigma factor
MEIVCDSDRAFVGLSGDIDSSWVETYKLPIAKLFEECPSVVVVDLASVTFMDSTGLGFLAHCVRACHDKDGVVYVIAPSQLIQRTIRLVGLDGFVTFVESANEIPNEQTSRNPSTVESFH